MLCLVHEQVYDVSSYLDEHPGGDDVVLAATGITVFFALKLLYTQNSEVIGSTFEYVNARIISKME